MITLALVALVSMLASTQAFVTPFSSSVTARRTAAPLAMSAGADGSNPSHKEYEGAAKKWAEANTHLSAEQISKTIAEAEEIVKQGMGSANDVRKEAQVRLATFLCLHVFLRADSECVHALTRW